MDKIFKSIGNASSAVMGKVLDALTLTPLEKVQGKEANAIERASKRVGEWFAPAPKLGTPDKTGYRSVTPQVRMRDFLREVPNAASDILFTPLVRSAGVVGEKIAKNDIGATYTPESELGKFAALDEKPMSFRTVGAELTGDKFAENNPWLASAIGGTIAVSDLFPGGSGRKAAARGTIDFVSDAARGLKKTLAREGDVAAIVDTLTSIGVRAEDAAEIAPAFAKANKTKDIETIADNYVQAKKAVDVPAEPVKKYFHGTKNPDSVRAGFDMSKAGENSGYPGVYGKGMYLTNDVARASDYGTPVEFNVDDLNLMTLKGGDEVLSTLFGKNTRYGDPDEIAKYVTSKGYDGLKIVGTDGAEELVVMNPSKAKPSAAAKARAIPDATEKSTKLYHGTLDDFDQFDFGKAGSNSQYPNSKFGVFFTDDPKVAGEFPEKTRSAGDARDVKIKEADVTLKNPIDLTVDGIFNKREQAPVIVEMLGGGKMNPDDALESLNETLDMDNLSEVYETIYSNIKNKKKIQDAGFDGIVSQYGENPDGSIIREYVVFEPNQINKIGSAADRTTEAFGGVAGIEYDEEGNITFDPLKGLAGAAVGGTVRRVKDGRTARWISDAAKVPEEVDEIGVPKGSRALAEQMPDPDTVVRTLKSDPQDVAMAAQPPKERRFVTRVRALDKNTSEYLNGNYTPRSTEELAKIADDLIENDYDRAFRMATEGTDDTAVAIASRLIDKFVTGARGTKDEALKAELYAKASTVANEAARTLTEHGRAIQAATLLGQTTPEGMVRFAAREIQKHNAKVDSNIGKWFGSKNKIPELTPDQAKSIIEKMEGITEIKDPVEKAMKIQEVTDEIRALVPSSLYDKISTVWKAGLLTGAKTHLLNFFSNLAFNVTEVVKDAPASVIDAVASLFTGKRTMAFTLRGMPKGMKDGASKGWRYWKTGFDERNVGSKLDFNKVNFGKGRIGRALQAYTDTVFRSLGTSDQPFYYGARLRSLASQAIATAKNEKLAGKAFDVRVQQLIDNPTDEMIRNATLDAETAVFQNKTWMGDAAKKIQQVPGFQFIIPFAKTPGAVVTQVWNYSPLGLGSELVTSIYKAARGGKFDQRAFSQAVGRGLIGTLGSLAIGRELFKNDKVSLAYPTSEKERRQWEMEGRRPNYIKVGDTWRNPAVLGPAGLAIVLGAHMENAMEKTGSPVGALFALMAGTGSTVTEQSFLQGLNQAIDALKDPERSFNGYASSLVGSIVPTLIADIARSVDTYERTTTSPTERLMSRVPGMRESLPERVNVLGEKVEVGNPLTAMFDPTRPGIPSADPNDPIVKELGRLAREGYVATPTQIGPNVGYETLTSEQNGRLRELDGQYMKNAAETVMKLKEYSQLDDEQRQKLLKKAMDSARVESRARYLVEATKGMSKQERVEFLEGLKKDKMLTKDVYAAYLSFKGQ